MKPLVRDVALLVTAVTLLFVVLGTLLWGWRVTTTRHAERSNEFLGPSQTAIARAQRTLTALRSDLYERAVVARGPGDIPYHFDALSALDNLDQHLLQIGQLGHAFDTPDAFGLSARAHEQLETARRAMLAPGALTPENTSHALPLLDPLQDTMEQLERVYEIELQDSTLEHRRITASSLRLVLLAAALSILVTVPIIFRLAFNVRDAVRRETRARSDLEEAQRNLEQMAMVDGLTELGNRHLFRARLEQVAGLAKRSDRFSALMYIDVDHFKRINDSLGHDAGDEVLRIVGARLVDNVRTGDTVARIGGDEFTVIVTDMVHHEIAGRLASKLLRRIGEPICVAGNELVVSASVGITIIPTDGDDPAALMKNADMALYRAKDHGRNRFEFYVEAMHRAMMEHMAMESALRSAIQQGEFALHYQPQVNLATGEPACVEALLRWRRADGTTVPPDEFIPVAEAAGLLTEIGGWVLRKACEDLPHMRRMEMPNLRMSVNLSARQFREPNLVARIEHALAAGSLAPAALEVEITETTLVENIDAAVETLQELRNLGVSIAIDDFGVGYSSLNYLKHLPIDVVKIDRSFIRDLETDQADRGIVDAVLAMARSLSLTVVAEGIETHWQLEYLTERRCGMGQGFLFSKPRPIAELSVWASEQPWRTAPVPAGRRVIARR